MEKSAQAGIHIDLTSNNNFLNLGQFPRGVPTIIGSRDAKESVHSGGQGWSECTVAIRADYSTPFQRSSEKLIKCESMFL